MAMMTMSRFRLVRRALAQPFHPLRVLVSMVVGAMATFECHSRTTLRRMMLFLQERTRPVLDLKG